MPDFYIGLMSGTSVDGIDAVLVDFSDGAPHLVSCLNKSWPENIRQAIFDSRQLPDEQLNTLSSLDRQTGEIFAQAVNQLLQQSDLKAKHIRAIGSHGQTIRHRPDANNAFSLQLGNAELIKQQTGISVVSDFRSADIAAGGQGAPLVPAFHQQVFRSQDKNRVVVNIGGFANITVLPKDTDQPVIGFDTGPGNCLMDAWIRQQKNKKYDENGRLAASGKTRVGLLAKLLMDEYFQLAAPKSTGFEYFNLDWLVHFFDKDLRSKPLNEKDVADVQSTLIDLSAVSIIRAINQYSQDNDEIFICGGGAHNAELMKRLQTLSNNPVNTTEILGVHPDWVEAMTFAWLAKQKLNNLPGNIPAVTGASKELVLGVMNHI